MRKSGIRLEEFSGVMSPPQILYSEMGPFRLPGEALCELQYHDVCELAICLEGNGLWFTEERVYAISKGDIIFAPPYTLHHTRAVGDTCLCEFVFFDEKRLLSENGITICPKLSSDIFGCPAIFYNSKHPKLHFLLKNLIDEAKTSSREKSITEKAVALWYSLFLLELQSSEKCERETDINSPLMPAIEKIVLNFQSPLTLEELADACSMSRNWFLHRFKAEYGKTPTRYLNDYRVKTAAHMLSESCAKIIDICTFVGYNHPTDLLRNFKQRYGLSPLEYRNKTRFADGENKENAPG